MLQPGAFSVWVSHGLPGDAARIASCPDRIVKVRGAGNFRLNRGGVQRSKFI
jgi:hypothetical protein